MEDKPNFQLWYELQTAGKIYTYERYEICDMRYEIYAGDQKSALTTYQSIMRQIIIKIGLQQQEKGEGGGASTTRL